MKALPIIIVVILIIIGVVLFLRSQGPLINDVTTDFQNPPEFVQLSNKYKDRDYSYNSEFATKQREYYPKIKPVLLNLEQKEALQAVKILIETKTSWQIVATDFLNSRIEATDTTKTFKFVDDISIELRKENEKQSVFHIRSKSRVGKGDFGKNAERIQEFLNLVKEI